MLPPAPGLFSTTTLWPHASPSFCAIVRPVVSSGPPGGNGTTSFAGFAGNGCAAADSGNADAAATPRRSAAIERHGPGGDFGITCTRIAKERRSVAGGGFAIESQPEVGTPGT